MNISNFSDMKDPISSGDQLLKDWALTLEKMTSGGIGYPSSTAEGRISKPTIHRPPGPIVPVIPHWSLETTVVDDAVRQLSNGHWRIVNRVYIDGYKPDERGEYSLLREARLAIFYFVAGCLWGKVS